MTIVILCWIKVKQKKEENQEWILMVLPLSELRRGEYKIVDADPKLSLWEVELKSVESWTFDQLWQPVEAVTGEDIAKKILLNTLKRANWLLWWVLNLNWNISKIACSPRKEYSWLLTIFTSRREKVNILLQYLRWTLLKMCNWVLIVTLLVERSLQNNRGPWC